MKEFETSRDTAAGLGASLCRSQFGDKSNRQYLFIILVTDLLDIEILQMLLRCSQHTVKCFLGVRTQNCQAGGVTCRAVLVPASAQLDHAVEVLADILHRLPAASLAPLGVTCLCFVVVCFCCLILFNRGSLPLSLATALPHSDRQGASPLALVLVPASATPEPHGICEYNHHHHISLPVVVVVVVVHMVMVVVSRGVTSGVGVATAPAQ